MKSNIQPSTFNLQRRNATRVALIGRWKLNVECLMFTPALLVLFAALPLRAQTIASDTNTLPDLLPPYGELPATFWEQHKTSAVVAGIGIVLLAAFIVWLVFRPKRKAIIPPEVQARQALEELHRQPEDGVVLSRISQVVRRYFIAVFQLPPGELTTAEFNRELARCHKINSELVFATIEFLRNCDARKFSPAAAGKPDAANRALNLVEQAEQRRAQSTQPANTPAQGPRA